MSKTFIIAEIGINHNGSLEICKDLIDTAVDCGCDAVKFQKRDIDIVYTNDFLSSERDSPWGKTQRDQKKGLEFGFITRVPTAAMNNDQGWSCSVCRVRRWRKKIRQQFSMPHLGYNDVPLRLN